jgi:hypothetical protein
MIATMTCITVKFVIYCMNLLEINNKIDTVSGTCIFTDKVQYFKWMFGLNSGTGNWENSANCDTSMKLSGNHL